MSDEIKVGDTVRLKSGGPVMVVEEIGEEFGASVKSAWCRWFDDKKVDQTKPFKLTSLELIQSY